jgi:hypothetical protein
MSTLSSVTDGQLCDDAGVPSGLPNVVAQDNRTQTASTAAAPIVSVQTDQTIVIPQQHATYVIVGR